MASEPVALRDNCGVPHYQIRSNVLMQVWPVRAIWWLAAQAHSRLFVLATTVSFVKTYLGGVLVKDRAGFWGVSEVQGQPRPDSGAACTRGEFLFRQLFGGRALPGVQCFWKGPACELPAVEERDEVFLCRVCDRLVRKEDSLGFHCLVCHRSPIGSECWGFWDRCCVDCVVGVDC